jgi:hypothetical protein
MSQNERHGSIKEILILHLGYSKGNGMQITYNELIGSLYEQKSLLWYHVQLLQLSAHTAATVLADV